MLNKSFITLIFTLIAFSNHLNAQELSETNNIHGVLIKATTPNRKEILFVPSQHNAPFNSFSNQFKRTVFQKPVLILESMQTSSESPYLRLMKYVNPQFLKERNFLQTPNDPVWKLPDQQEMKISSLFKAVKSMIGTNYPEETKSIDLSLLDNIYRMKPGVVFALHWKISSLISHKSLDLGMDTQIINNFFEHKKVVLAIETLDDVIESLSLNTITYEDIQDDFEKPDAHNNDPYPASLHEMEENYKSKSSEKRLASKSKSLEMRNKKWIEKYEEYLKIHDDIVAVHGLFHFFGEVGVIVLTQQMGWRWSVYDYEKKTYVGFTYSPKEENPFVYKY